MLHTRPAEDSRPQHPSFRGSETETAGNCSNNSQPTMRGDARTPPLPLVSITYLGKNTHLETAWNTFSQIHILRNVSREPLAYHTNAIAERVFLPKRT